MNNLGAYAMPTLIFLIICYSVRKTNVYDSFVEGAKEGFETFVRVLPNMVALVIGVGALRSSGILDGLETLISPFCEKIGLPAQLVPLFLVRPISGSGATALFCDVLEKYGADSLIGRSASVLMGASETTFYTIAVYFGASGVKNIRYTVFAALFADFMAFLISVLTVKIIFY